jgi:hypothetical protein
METPHLQRGALNFYPDLDVFAQGAPQGALAKEDYLDKPALGAQRGLRMAVKQLSAGYIDGYAGQ